MFEHYGTQNPGERFCVELILGLIPYVTDFQDLPSPCAHEGRPLLELPKEWMTVTNSPCIRNGTAFEKCFAVCAVAIFSLPLQAQYLGDQYPGLVGLNAGSQPAPGVYVTIPLYLRDSEIGVHNAQGDEIFKNVRGTLGLWVLPAATVVTPLKILGANYSFGVTQWQINGTLNVAANNIQKSSGYNYGDLYVQPVTLGWHTNHVDTTIGYAFFAPTGVEASGQQMWVNEAIGGFTVRPGKNFNLYTVAFYDFHHKKDDSDIKVGNILTLGGGIGRSFLHGAGNVGVAYSAQWKVTHDKGSDIPRLLPITNGRVFGVGPQLDVPVFAKGASLGILGFRYEWLVGAKTALGGQILVASFTFATIAKAK